jgi:hypothetical protein
LRRNSGGKRQRIAEIVEKRAHLLLVGRDQQRVERLHVWLARAEARAVGEVLHHFAEQHGGALAAAVELGVDEAKLVRRRNGDADEAQKEERANRSGGGLGKHCRHAVPQHAAGATDRERHAAARVEHCQNQPIAHIDQASLVHVERHHHHRRSARRRRRLRRASRSTTPCRPKCR